MPQRKRRITTQQLNGLPALFAITFAAVALAAQVQGQDFSADLVSRGNADVPGIAKIYGGIGKIRIDVPPSPPNKSGPLPAGFTLWYVGHIRLSPASSQGRTDPKSIAVYFLELYHLMFQPADGTDLCQKYISHIKEITDAQNHPNLMEIANQTACEDLGVEETGGRKAQKLRVAYPKTGEFLMWVDTKLHFVIRVDLKNGRSFALENVKEAAQPAELFEIPADARKI